MAPHNNHNERIGTRCYIGARPVLIPIRELEPEDARWVQPPRHAWYTIEENATAGLCHHPALDDSSHVGSHGLSEFMDDALGRQWHDGSYLDQSVRSNLLRRMRDEIETGRWVVLGWQATDRWPVTWAADPEHEGDGQWRVRDDAWRLGDRLQSALRGRLAEAYRVRRARAGPASTRRMELLQLRMDDTMSPPRTGRLGPASMDEPQVLSKAQRWQTRKRLISAGRGNSSQRVRGAADRLARNNVAVEKARLAEHVYDPSKAVPEGWVNRSGDGDELELYNLRDEDLGIKSSNFRAQLYEPETSVFGNDMKTTLAFKGTDMSSFEDWSNNFRQSLNIESPYYEKAVNIGKKLKQAMRPIDITGHSQGGGLCAATSVASGKDCWSFNAAGLHPKTVAHYGAQVSPSTINAFHVKGEILTLVQQWTPLPNAIGTPYPLSGSGLPLSRHSIKQVIAGIEKQKTEDISVLDAIS